MFYHITFDWLILDILFNTSSTFKFHHMLVSDLRIIIWDRITETKGCDFVTFVTFLSSFVLSIKWIFRKLSSNLDLAVTILMLLIQMNCPHSQWLSVVGSLLIYIMRLIPKTLSLLVRLCGILFHFARHTNYFRWKEVWQAIKISYNRKCIKRNVEF